LQSIQGYTLGPLKASELGSNTPAPYGKVRQGKVVRFREQLCDTWILHLLGWQAPLGVDISLHSVDDSEPRRLLHQGEVIGILGPAGQSSST